MKKLWFLKLRTEIDLRIILHRRKIFFFRPPSSTSPSSAYTAALIKLRFFWETSAICKPSKLKIFQCLCLLPCFKRHSFELALRLQTITIMPICYDTCECIHTSLLGSSVLLQFSSLQTTDQNAAGSRTPDNVLILHSKPKFTGGWCCKANNRPRSCSGFAMLHPGKVWWTSILTGVTFRKNTSFTSHCGKNVFLYIWVHFHCTQTH